MGIGKPVVKSTVMEKEMVDYVVLQTRLSLDKGLSDKVSNSFQEVATRVKSDMEEHYKSTWHCIVGRNFGAYVTHEIGRYIFFYIGQKGFLVFSTVRILILSLHNYSKSLSYSSRE